MYRLIKKYLFSLEPEQAHDMALNFLQLAYQYGLWRFFRKVPAHPCTLMGLTFQNRVGLAAGFDINADYLDALSKLGFGFIEIGGVTPKPQTGHARPRIFRLTLQKGIINRKGFDNKGADYIAEQLAQTKYRGILGINLTKNRDTPNAHAIDDYLTGFRKLWPYADYITINISSPNTPQLRDMQKGSLLSDLLSAMKQEQTAIQANHQKYIPLVVKISPDLSDDELHELAMQLLKYKIDGVIATNSSISRDGVEMSPYAREAGGLSGQPLQARSARITRQLKKILGQHIPIIASGGIMDETSARERVQAGARLLQIYSGFIYEGPGLIRRLANI
ncbi:MAG: dihydroorotate dehydrogenase (quinone) [Gammaproteobacteria bacterium RIFCSPHIGHO2_12_FULL_45_12]|nr:MAG: dihydroorotate dehydrogenase (quinone) [Gammaproteobacteria bacterium RIFCSPHIGHO2_12_FULL_45_12]